MDGMSALAAAAAVMWLWLANNISWR